MSSASSSGCAWNDTKVYGTSRPPLRIAHVTDFYLPRCGGIELQVRDLSHRQAAAGHEVSVITSTPGGAVPMDRSGGGVRVHRLATSGKMPGHSPEVRKALRATLRAGRFDVVHVHAAPWAPLAFTAAALADEQPTLVTMHSILGPVEVIARAVQPVLRFGAWPAVWTAVSDVAARPMRRVLGAQVHVLPNGVDVASWHVRPVPRDPNDVVALAVMRLTGRKRGLPLLKVLEQAREHLPEHVRLRTMIIGDGPRRASMQRFLDKHDMGADVVLAGRRPRADVRTALARADVFLAPAILESFGIAAMEARCAGVPVVARAESGTGEFIRHGQEGLLADSDAAMASALVSLATDSVARARIAAHNRTVAPESDWNSVLERTAELYRLAGAVSPLTALEAAS